MTPALSVVVRTRYRDPALLGRVLDALRAQDLPHDAWELRLVENAVPSRDEPSLAWHPRARRVEAPEAGKLPALIAGLAAVTGEVAVIVDDDNLLEPDYLRQIRSLFAEPGVGTANGVVAAAFEATPPPFLPLFEADLALWDLGPAPRRTSHAGDPELPAWGAGLAVRRAVFEAFLDAHRRDPRRRLYGPAGFDAGEDLDLAAHVFAAGLARVYAPALRLRHAIPAARLEAAALLRLARVNACAFEYTRGLASRERAASAGAWRGLVRDLAALRRGGLMMFRRRRALRAGRRDARRLLASQPLDPPPQPPIER